MDDNYPRTAEALLEYLGTHCADIYVRDELNGKPGSYSLAELPAERVIFWILHFWKLGKIPHRVVEPTKN